MIDKQEHKMYLNVFQSFQTLSTKHDKQEHKMYLNNIELVFNQADIR